MSMGSGKKNKGGGTFGSPPSHRGASPASSSSSSSSSSCRSHDHELMRPIVLPSWRAAQHARAQRRKGSEVVAESRVLRESFPVPDTGGAVSLVYSSSGARGYLSTLELRLTPPEGVPQTLRRVHLRISVEGALTEKTFEADPDLKYTHSWRRLNVYRQRVYGTASAMVRVGYVYSDCPGGGTVWVARTVRILGEGLATSGIGGWNFDVHHRYNYQEGILHRGDGSTVFLRERPRLMSRLIGEPGKARPMECASKPSSVDCHKGRASEQRLLAPVAMAAAADGSVYVGDFDLVRRVRPDGHVSSVLRMPTDKGSAYRYNLAVHPHDDSLYVSDPENHRIVRVLDNSGLVSSSAELEKNFEVVVGGGGGGSRCLPGQEGSPSCGDGGPALEARLSYPKGMAFSADGRLYFADGTSIRVVSTDGKVATLMGGAKDGLETTFGGRLQDQGSWQPWSCGGARDLSEAALRWPTQLAVNPLDDTLHFIDDNLVLKVTPDEQVQVVAGRPLHCHHSRRKESSYASYFGLASQTTLVSPQSLSFAPCGDLFVAESDGGRVNRVSKVGADNSLAPFAGRDRPTAAKESKREDGKGPTLALDSVLGSVSAVAVGPDGVVYVADAANREVKAVRSRIPAVDEKKKVYTVLHPETQESYTFNRFGLHTETRHLVTGQLLRSFSYSVKTSSGLIVGVSDAKGNTVKVMRNYAGQVTSLETPSGRRLGIGLDRTGMLSRLSWGEGGEESSSEFSYFRNSELVLSKRDERGNYFSFSYDDNGRLEEAVLPTGEKIRLDSDLETRGAVVNVTRDGELERSLLIRPGLVRSLAAGEEEGGEEEDAVGTVVQMRSDRSFSASDNRRGSRIEVGTAQLRPEGEEEEADGVPVPSSERSLLGKDLVNLFEWRFRSPSNNKKGGGRSRRHLLSKTLRVNGQEVLEAELNLRRPESELIKLNGGETVLNVTGSDAGGELRIDVLPSGLFSSSALRRTGREEEWRFGELSHSLSYDAHGRPTSFSVCGRESLGYVYPGGSGGRMPEKVTVASGGAFLLGRDADGALSSVTTPRGHIHGFSARNSFGAKKYLYQSPWSRRPYEFHYDGRGRMVARTTPGAGFKTVVRYEESSDSPRFVVGGGTTVSLRYFGRSEVPRSAERTEEESGYRARSEFRHHHGMVKEQRTTFHPDNPNELRLENYKLRFQYDGRARLSVLAVTFGKQEDKEALETVFRHDATTGRMEAQADLRFRRESLRRRVVENSAKSFSSVTDTDASGRISARSISFRGAEVFRMELGYGERSQVTERNFKLGGRAEARQEISYDADGRLKSVTSSSSSSGRSWTYSHDANGNVVSVKSSSSSDSVDFGYDAGDRVATLGDVEFVVYDDGDGGGRGNVAKRGDLRFAYNGLGQLAYAEKFGRFGVDYYYDHLGRLSARRDSRGDTAQYVYAHPRLPHLPTHVRTRSGTARLHYDQDGHLAAVDAPAEGRLYVATDQLGSPVAAFAAQGETVKEVSYSPFGEVVGDTNPALELHVGFSGGLACPLTGLVHFQPEDGSGMIGGGSRAYDPGVGQWLTPLLPNPMERGMRRPEEVFAYRFRNNDPFNPTDMPRPSDSLSWLKLLGLPMGDLLGSSLHFFPTPPPRAVAPDLSLSVGLRNTLSQSTSLLSQPGFSSTSSSSFALPDLSDGGRLSPLPSPFGAGLLVSDVAGEALVSSAPVASSSSSSSQGSGGGGSAPDVAHSVFASVLNATEVLEASRAGDETYFFLKREEGAFNSDYQEVQRLSGSYNVSVETLRPSGRQLCASGSLDPKGGRRSGSTVCLVYGADRRTAARHLLRAAHKRAAEAAWRREAAAARAGLLTAQRFASQQRAELSKRGQVRGYQAAEVRGAHRFPELIGHSSNIVFVRDEEADRFRTERKRGNNRD